MSFMTLNGFVVPVASCSEQTIELGASQRAFNDSLRLNRRGNKRQWSVKTALMSNHDASLLESMLRGHYDVWDWSSEYSLAGRPPVLLADVALHDGIADDGIQTLESWSTKGSACPGYAATTNLLPGADDNNFNPAPPVTTCVANTDYYLFGASCLEIGLQAAQSIKSDVTAAVGVAHVGSIYVMSKTAGARVSVCLRNDSTGVEGTAQTPTLVAYRWTRIQDLTVAHVNGNNLCLKITNNVGGTTITIYADGAQIEAAAIELSRPYTATSNADTNAGWYYDLDKHESASGLCIAGAVRRPRETGATDWQWIVSVGTDALAASAGAPFIAIAVKHDDFKLFTNSYDVTCGAAFWAGYNDGDFVPFICCVDNIDGYLRVYRNDVLLQQSAGTEPDIGDLDVLYIGDPNAADFDDCTTPLLDGIYLGWHATNTDMITNFIDNPGKWLSTKLFAQGGFLRSDLHCYVHAQLEKSDYQYSVGDTLARSVSFKLEEF